MVYRLNCPMSASSHALYAGMKLLETKLEGISLLNTKSLAALTLYSAKNAGRERRSHIGMLSTIHDPGATAIENWEVDLSARFTKESSPTQSTV